MRHQEKINWKEPVLNSTLAEELYVLLLKIPTLPALNSEKNTNINSVENLLRSFTDDIKVDILKNIDKNWKTIFDSKKEEEIKQHFTTPYGMKCYFLNIFNMILDEAIKTKEKIILDNKEIIIASIEKYIDNSTDAKEIIQKVSYIDLNKSLNEKAPERKRLKI